MPACKRLVGSGRVGSLPRRTARLRAFARGPRPSRAHIRPSSRRHPSAGIVRFSKADSLRGPKIDAGAGHEASIRVLRRASHWFADIERSVDDDGTARSWRGRGGFCESRLGISRDGLHASLSVDVRHRRHVAPWLVQDSRHVVPLEDGPSHGNPACRVTGADQQHIWAISLEFKVLGRLFGEHRRAKWPEALAKLESDVQRALHVGPPASQRIDRAPRPRTELHARLENRRPCRRPVRRPRRLRARPDPPLADKSLLACRGTPRPRAARTRGQGSYPSANRPARSPCAARPEADERTKRAAPSAPPASPAAGWMNNPSTHARRPFATQLSATPPAITRFFVPVIFVMCTTSFSITSSVTSCTDAARSIWRRMIGASGFRAGPPNSSSKRALVINGLSRRLPEVARVEAERAVFFHVDELVANDVGVAGLSIGCECSCPISAQREGT